MAPEDMDEMASAIRRLIDDTELAGRIADAGRSNAVRRFGIARYRTEIAELVASLSFV